MTTPAVVSRPVHWWHRAGALASGAAASPRRFDPADFTPALQTQLLILQPTPFCNLDCDYCYLPQRDVRARMAMQTLRQAASRLLDDGLVGPRLTVVWHAGEPMTVPPSWYEEAFGVLAQVLGPQVQVEHAMQTNATLIDAAWCALIQRHGVHIGVSVDGPAHLHDAHRRGRGGQGSHARVMRGLQQLREAGIGFHAIAVVTQATLDAPDAFLDFFASCGAHELGCNFDEAEGLHAQSSLAGHEAAHGRFLQRLLTRSSDGSMPLAVRELTMAAQLIAAPLLRWHWRDDTSTHAWPLNAQVQPFAMVNVAHDGRFGTFSPELLGQPAPAYDDFCFGQVAREGYFAAARRSEAFQRAWQHIAAGVRRCEATCAYFAYCGGGAPANKFYELGDLGGGETLYCRTMVQRPFDAVLTQAEHWLAGAAAPQEHSGA